MHTEEFVSLPELGEGVTEGELVKWLVSEGESIKTDQPVAEVMTDKAVMEIPSPVEGTVESFSAKEGDTIPVGHKLLKLSQNSSGAKGHKGTDDVLMAEPQEGKASHKDKSQTKNHDFPKDQGIRPSGKDAEHSLDHIKASPSLADGPKN